jgi:hypothetical protein
MKWIAILPVHVIRPGYWQLCFPHSAALASHLSDLIEYVYWLVCDRAR